MKKAYHIEKLSTHIYLNDYNDGDLAYSNSWNGPDVLHALMYKEFGSIADILKLLNDKYLELKADTENIKNWKFFDDFDLGGEIRFTSIMMIDEDNRIANESDLEAWMNGKKRLYKATTILYVKADHASTSDLVEESRKLGLDPV